MTDTVPAAAAGLPASDAPAFDRRSFLATLAAAGVMAGAAADAAPAIAADHPDAGLLKLVAAIFAAEAEWDRFNTEGEAIWARFDDLAPTVPTALLYQEGRDTWEICYDPRRLATVEIDGVDRRHYSDGAEARSLRWAVGIWRREGTGRNVVERAEEILAALDVYAPALEQAKIASGLRAHEDAIAENCELMDTLRHDIASVSASTTAGVAAKARAAALNFGDREYLATVMLPQLIRDEGLFGNHPWRQHFMLAISVVADAMALDTSAVPAPAPTSAPVAA